MRHPRLTNWKILDAGWRGRLGRAPRTSTHRHRDWRSTGCAGPVTTEWRSLKVVV
jgi:hypothetical protein